MLASVAIDPAELKRGAASENFHVVITKRLKVELYPPPPRNNQRSQEVATMASRLNCILLMRDMLVKKFGVFLAIFLEVEVKMDFGIGSSQESREKEPTPPFHHR